MLIDHRAKLTSIKRFDQLIVYLRDELGWPISRESFEDVEDLFYDFTPDELGIDPKTAAKIQEIKRLRPLSPSQPWGVFFVKFEPKKLPVVALRRILSRVALKKRASANSSLRAAWEADDLLFISNYGEGDERQISFAHFSRALDDNDLPTLKVLGWDNLDTALHLDAVARELNEHLTWPDDDTDANAWRARWRAAFTIEHREVVTTSKELSIRLAKLARNICDRIMAALAIETDAGPLTQLMQAFKTALVHDLDAGSFSDMYAQTIAYGLLSARIADPHRKTADDFAAHMRTNPFLRELMQTFLKVGGRRGKAGGPGIDFDELGVSEVVELLDDANMEAVVRDFGDRNPQEDPIIHFYEDFVKEYDKSLWKGRGVIYTPRPVVLYIVRSIDELLRTEFGLSDGLADTTSWGEMVSRYRDLKLPVGMSPDMDFVQILDPATGTGTFLVEVIDFIHKTLVDKWKGQGHGQKKINMLWNEYVPKHLLTRLHGYELLMAPYAIAHLKIGLKLYETGYRFESQQRARVYLTNALEPAHDSSGKFEFALPALAREADAVNHVKRLARFTVVIGNPPYAGHSLNNKIAWIVDKVHDYKRDIPELARPAQAKWLQDDYVKFIRLGEYTVEAAGTGLLGYISNHSYLDNPTFRGMRRHFIQNFPVSRFLDLHGNTKKRETAPDGSPDENVFDIQQGVSIVLATRPPREVAKKTSFFELIGLRQVKYAALMSDKLTQQPWREISPTSDFFLLRPEDASLRQEYLAYLPLPMLMGENGDPAPGIVTTQDEFAISWSKKEMESKVIDLLSTHNEKEARDRFRLCGQTQWSYTRAKAELPKLNWQDEIGRVLYRPFDVRWTVYNPNVAVHRRMRVSQHFLAGRNLGLCVGKAGQVVGAGEWNLVSCTRQPVDFNYFYRGGACNFPLLLMPVMDRLGLVQESRVNMAASFLAGLRKLENVNEISEQVSKAALAQAALEFIYAILHSRSYRSRYADFLKIDFPRVPRPTSQELFYTLARLGGELIALHLLEVPNLDLSTTEYIGSSAPEVEKVSWSNDTVWLDKAKSNGFRGVCEEVWNFHIGGYQVCKKWLKDRKGHTLSKTDIHHYRMIIVSLLETIRLMEKIDSVVEEYGGWPKAFH